MKEPFLLTVLDVFRSDIVESVTLTSNVALRHVQNTMCVDCLPSRRKTVNIQNAAFLPKFNSFDRFHVLYLTFLELISKPQVLYRTAHWSSRTWEKIHSRVKGCQEIRHLPESSVSNSNILGALGTEVVEQEVKTGDDTHGECDEKCEELHYQYNVVQKENQLMNYCSGLFACVSSWPSNTAVFLSYG